MEIQKTIKIKVGELRKGKQVLIDNAINNSINSIKDFMGLSIKNKTTSNTKLHHLGYKEAVNKYKLPACIIHQSRNKAREITVGFSFIEPKAVIEKEVQKSINNKEDVSPPNPEGMGIRNIDIL